METSLKCEKCGKEVEYLNRGLCDDCYMEENEGPCFCYDRLERFKQPEK